MSGILLLAVGAPPATVKTWLLIALHSDNGYCSPLCGKPAFLVGSRVLRSRVEPECLTTFVTRTCR